jgi:hypothetical protein
MHRDAESAPPTRFWLPSRSASVSAKYASGSISSDENHASASMYNTLSIDGSSNKAKKAKFLTPFNVFVLPRVLSRHRAHGASTRAFNTDGGGTPIQM